MTRVSTAGETLQGSESLDDLTDSERETMKPRKLRKDGEEWKAARSPGERILLEGAKK